MELQAATRINDCSALSLFVYEGGGGGEGWNNWEGESTPLLFPYFCVEKERETFYSVVEDGAGLEK